MDPKDANKAIAMVMLFGVFFGYLLGMSMCAMVC